MKSTFSCQIQPDRLPPASEAAVLAVIQQCKKAWTELVEFEVGDNDGPYINVSVETAERLKTWMRIKSELVDARVLGRQLRSAMIVTVTGTDEWNDYLLLHHFDEQEPVDRLES